MTLTTFTDTLVSSDATFRTWASAWDTAIRAVGMVKVTQTGEINLATVTRPGSTNTKAGFFVYSFNDANQASYPCYIRVDFGVATSTSYPSLWVKIGTTVDGSGNLGGATSPSIQTQQHPTTPYISAVSGSTSRLTIITSYTSGSYQYTSAYDIERICDATGADTTTGLVMTWIKAYAGTNTNSVNGQAVLYFTGSQPAALDNSSGRSGVNSVFYSSNNTSSQWANGASVYCGLIYPVGRTAHFPIQGLMLYYPGDIPPTTTPTISLYGTNRTWYAMPLNSAQYLGNDSSQRLAFLARWD